MDMESVDIEQVKARLLKNGDREAANLIACLSEAIDDLSEQIAVQYDNFQELKALLNKHQ